MGTNGPTPQQPQTPQPYSGTRGVGTAANSAAQQLTNALMAKQRMQQYQQRMGVPSYGVPTAQPGAVTPNAPPLSSAAPGVTPPIAGAVPPGMLQGMPAPNPQAQASPLMQTTPGLTPGQ